MSLRIETEHQGYGPDVPDEYNKRYPTITARLSPEDRDRLEKAAKRYKRSVAFVVRETLSLAIDRGLIEEAMESSLPHNDDENDET